MVEGECGGERVVGGCLTQFTNNEMRNPREN